MNDFKFKTAQIALLQAGEVRFIIYDPSNYTELSIYPYDNLGITYICHVRINEHGNTGLTIIIFHILDI